MNRMVYVDDVSMAGRRQNMGPMWKKFMKLVVFGESVSHNILGCTQRECEPNYTVCDEYRNVRITNFCWSNRKIVMVVKNLTQKLLRDPKKRRVMKKKSAWRDIASCQTSLSI